MRLTLNDMVRAKITPYGKELIKQHIDEFNRELAQRYAPQPALFQYPHPDYDKDDCITNQVWTILAFFDKWPGTIGSDLPLEWIETLPEPGNH